MKRSLILILIIFLSLFSGCNDGNDKSGEDTNVPIEIGFATESINISGSTGETNIIYKTTDPSEITFSVSGFENVTWYVNTAVTPTGTGSSITLDAQDFEVGVHTISFTGFKSGRIFSDSVLFTVCP